VGGYQKRIEYNEKVEGFRGTHPRCSQDDRTLSKKGRGVKIELDSPQRRRGRRGMTLRFGGEPFERHKA